MGSVKTGKVSLARAPPAADGARMCCRRRHSDGEYLCCKESFRPAPGWGIDESAAGRGPRAAGRSDASHCGRALRWLWICDRGSVDMNELTCRLCGRAQVSEGEIAVAPGAASPISLVRFCDDPIVDLVRYLNRCFVGSKCKLSTASEQ